MSHSRRAIYPRAIFPGPSRSDMLRPRGTATTDAAIDDLVYELCGITDDERKITEGTL
jgi:hypothetical protein